jgi:hypothetical protein
MQWHSDNLSVKLAVLLSSTSCIGPRLHSPAHVVLLYAASYFVANMVFLAGVFSFAAVIGKCVLSTRAPVLARHAVV